jgi:WXXGXW repeat (2 copies)
MKQYFFLLLSIFFISFSSFIMHRNTSLNRIEITDSTPVPAKTDSVWIGSGYGWTHGTYHWISGHWEVAKKKKSLPTSITAAPFKDSTVVKDSSVAKKTAIPTDSTTAKTPVKDSTANGRIYIKGHRELQHNNYVWVPAHWEAAPVPSK